MIENNDQQEKWDKALLGESHSDSKNPIEKKAHTVRQMILWEAAQEEKDLIPTHQAIRFHKQVVRINRQRKWIKWGSISALSISIITLAAYLIMHPPITEQGTTVVDHNLPDTIINNASADMPHMLEIPAGKFRMGCVDGWDDSVGACKSNERPFKNVNIAKFALSKYEVTVGQFSKFIQETHYKTTAESNDVGCTREGKPDEKDRWVVDKSLYWKSVGFNQSESHPVVCVSWYDAQEYVKWLNKKSGGHYRLPTEAEWEYAARSGKPYPFFWGETARHENANYFGVEGRDKWDFTAPVGQFTASPSPFGLHDMIGNVWELTGSCWRKDYKSECENDSLIARRGGSWLDIDLNIRASKRSPANKIDRSVYYGFRVAHDLK